MSRCVLAIETSTTRASLAVVKAGEVVFEAAFASKRSHNSQLFGPLLEALEAAGDDLDLVVVGLGPGSYTGVRISISAAHGVALSKGVPLVGWSSLTAGEGVDERDYGVVGDARRGRLYLAEVRGGDLTAAPELVSVEAARERVLADDNAAAGASSWLTFDETSPLPLPEVDPERIRLVRPSAVSLALRGARASEDEIAAQASAALEPIYLEGAFITVAKKKG